MKEEQMQQLEKFSVLMSLYEKERPEYFRQCMKSILNQTIVPNQIVVVKDGPLTMELETVLAEFEKQDPDLYTIVSLEVNGGLGLALAEGIQHCRYELVARMDTDDLSVKNRFERQLKEFAADPELDICGSYIVEFENHPKNIVSRRIVPLKDERIKKYQRRRDAFNHMTVMYKKSAVLKAGNYQSCLLMEDTLLWVHMIQNKVKCKNIDKPLVYVRVGNDMLKRRGGLEYFKKYRSGRKKVWETGFIRWYDYYITIWIQFFVSLIPIGFRGIIFKRLLHR